MKLELQENTYVRTKDNGICKLYREFSEDSVDVGIAIFPEINGFFIDKEEINYIEKEDIVEASFNIIDILECGDFLDNHCIIKIENDTCYLNDGWFINADDIENLVTSICTKELFEQMSYKLGE